MKAKGGRKYTESPSEAIVRSVATLGIIPIIRLFRSAMADFRIAFNLPPKKKK